MRRVERVLAALAVTLLAGGFATPALAVPTQAQPACPAPGPWSAGAGGKLLELTSADTPADSPLAETPTVSDLGLGTTSVDVNSTGGVNGDPSLKSAASAANTDEDDVAEEVQLSDTLVSAAQAAPPSEQAETSDQLGEVPAGPVLEADVSRATARALWDFDAALPAPDVAVAHAHDDIAGAALLENVPDDGTHGIALDGDDQGMSFTESTVTLPSIGGECDQRAVLSQALTQLSGLDLFGQIHVGVVEPPVLQASATGLPGGAQVTYNAPILTVEMPDQEPQVLEPGEPQTFALPDNPLVTLTLTAGEVVTSTASPDGTSASGSAYMLHLAVSVTPDTSAIPGGAGADGSPDTGIPTDTGGLDLPGLGELGGIQSVHGRSAPAVARQVANVIDLTVAPMTVAAGAPAGGLFAGTPTGPGAPPAGGLPSGGLPAGAPAAGSGGLAATGISSLPALAGGGALAGLALAANRLRRRSISG
jgi:hypothetical protein